MAIQAIDVRNQFRGAFKETIRGEVVSEVSVEIPSGIEPSVIATRAGDEPGLRPDSEVVALVKSTELSIATL